MSAELWLKILDRGSNGNLQKGVKVPLWEANIVNIFRKKKWKTNHNMKSVFYHSVLHITNKFQRNRSISNIYIYIYILYMYVYILGSYMLHEEIKRSFPIFYVFFYLCSWCLSAKGNNDSILEVSMTQAMTQGKITP